MKRTTQTIRALTLLASAVGLFGCGSERIDANVTYLADGNAPAAAKGTWLEIMFAPDSSLRPGPEVRIRVDGQWLLFSAEQPSYVTLLPVGEYGQQADNLALASHIFQLVDPDGRVRLTTAPIDLTPGRANQLVVFGSQDKLDYLFFGNTDAELASVPSGMVLARVVNVLPDRRAFPLRTCAAPSDPAATTNITDCTVVADNFAYGQVWQALVPRETNLGIPCDSASPDVLCYLWGLGRSCYLSPHDETTTPAQITLLALSDTNAYFAGSEYPVLDTCY